MMWFANPILWDAGHIADPRIAIGTDGINAYDGGINEGSKEARHGPGHIECDT